MDLLSRRRIINKLIAVMDLKEAYNLAIEALKERKIGDINEIPENEVK